MKYFPSELLEEITRRLVQDLHPEQIILFGLHAYGQPSETSDIDLQVATVPISFVNQALQRGRVLYG